MRSKIMYSTTNIFSQFVCALLSFRAHEFPTKSQKREPGENIVECILYVVDTLLGLLWGQYVTNQ